MATRRLDPLEFKSMGPKQVMCLVCRERPTLSTSHVQSHSRTAKHIRQLRRAKAPPATQFPSHPTSGLHSSGHGTRAGEAPAVQAAAKDLEEPSEATEEDMSQVFALLRELSTGPNEPEDDESEVPFNELWDPVSQERVLYPPQVNFVNDLQAKLRAGERVFTAHSDLGRHVDTENDLPDDEILGKCEPCSYSVSVVYLVGRCTP